MSARTEAAKWNRRVRVGDWVDYESVIGLSEPLRFKTRSEASALSGHTAVVWLEGKSGCVCCSHCTPVAAALGQIAPENRTEPPQEQKT